MGGVTRAAQDISFDAMVDKQRRLAQMVLDDPAVGSVTASVGGNGPGGGSLNVAACSLPSSRPTNARALLRT